MFFILSIFIIGLIKPADISSVSLDNWFGANIDVTELRPAKITEIKSNVLKGLSIGEFISWLKNVDLDGLQEGIGNVQRVLGVVTDLAKSDSKNKESVAYKPRPLYRHFED